MVDGGVPLWRRLGHPVELGLTTATREQRAPVLHHQPARQALRSPTSQARHGRPCDEAPQVLRHERRAGRGVGPEVSDLELIASQTRRLPASTPSHRLRGLAWRTAPAFEHEAAASWLVWMLHEAAPPPGPEIPVEEVPYDEVHELRVVRHSRTSHRPVGLPRPGSLSRRGRQPYARGSRKGRLVSYAQLDRLGNAAEGAGLRTRCPARRGPRHGGHAGGDRAARDPESC